MKYKKYKNKLMNIMRFRKNDYYNKQLLEYRTNAQGTWKVLNSIIKNVTGKLEYPHFFKIKNNQPIMTKIKETTN